MASAPDIQKIVKQLSEQLKKIDELQKERKKVSTDADKIDKSCKA
jgi:conjugal transfer/entry exclusion protein